MASQYAENVGRHMGAAGSVVAKRIPSLQPVLELPDIILAKLAELDRVEVERSNASRSRSLG